MATLLEDAKKLLNTVNEDIHSAILNPVDRAPLFRSIANITVIHSLLDIALGEFFTATDKINTGTKLEEKPTKLGENTE